MQRTNQSKMKPFNFKITLLFATLLGCSTNTLSTHRFKPQRSFDHSTILNEESIRTTEKVYSKYNIYYGAKKLGKRDFVNESCFTFRGLSFKSFKNLVSFTKTAFQKGIEANYTRNEKKQNQAPMKNLASHIADGSIDMNSIYLYFF